MIYLLLDYNGMLEDKSMREIKQIKCSECQNQYYDDQDTCPFCGHKTSHTAVENESQDTFNDNQTNPSSSQTTKSQLTDQDIIILIVLGIFFWPAALIFLFVKLKK